MDTEYLLNRLYNKIGNDGIKKRIIVPRPDTYLENKKTYIKNYIELKNKLEREHVLSIIEYIKNELSAEVSINVSSELIICGIFRQNTIEKLIKEYCIKYIQCKMCKCGDTCVIKDNKILFIVCNNCKSKMALE